MATPQDRPAPSEVQWAPDTDYRPNDNYGTGVCAMWGYPKRDGELIYRGPFVDEFMGNFAIGQDAAEDLAALIGWVDPDGVFDSYEAEVKRLKAENESLHELIAHMKSVLGGLV